MWLDSDCISLWNDCNMLMKVKCNAVGNYIYFRCEFSIIYCLSMKRLSTIRAVQGRFCFSVCNIFCMPLMKPIVYVFCIMFFHCCRIFHTHRVRNHIWDDCIYGIVSLIPLVPKIRSKIYVLCHRWYGQALCSWHGHCP